MQKILPLLLLALLAGAQQGNLSEYALALTGELAACKKYAAECEALQRSFVIQSQEREQNALKEIARLKAERQRLESQKQVLIEKKKHIEAESKTLENRIQALQAPLSAAERKLEEQKAYLPVSLRETLLPPLKGDDLAARLSRYLDTIASINDFSQNVQKPFPIRLQGADSVTREYQVLLCGFSLALAYSEGTENAGIGIRSMGNWHWFWDKNWHGQIKKAVEICSGARAPELLSLPLPAIINMGSGQ